MTGEARWVLGWEEVRVEFREIKKRFALDKLGSQQAMAQASPQAYRRLRLILRG